MKKKLTALFLSLLMSVQMLPLFALAEEAEPHTESIIPLELPEHIALQEETAPAQADLTEADNQYAAYSFNETTQKLTKTLCDIPSATTITGTTTVWETGWYIADGTVELSSARVGGDVKLVLKDGCKLTVGGITVTESDRLTIYAQKNGTGELISAASANNYAGIGGGSKEDGGIITIHGGKITATGGEMAAGIGGGSQGACGTVTIYGGEVTAAGGFNGAGIGTGSAPRNSGGSIAVYGGTVTVSTTDNSAMGDQRPRAIGGGFGGSVDTITINSKMEVKDGSGNAVTLNNTWAETLTGCAYTIYALPVVEYRYYDEEQQKFVTGECDDYTLVTSETTAWTEGWYVVNEDVTIKGTVYFSGDTNLILCDGKTLTIGGTGMIHTSNDGGEFTVYTQSDGENMGSLNAYSIENGAHSVVINGGNVTSQIKSVSGSIVINGGVVAATGDARCIYAANSIKINGGAVTATASIGEGIYANNGIIINGCKVTATGESYGIYSNGNIEINGGTVTATGSRGAGIYLSSEEVVCVYLNGGTVTAQGGNYGIYSNRNISIENSKVFATGNISGIYSYSLKIDGSNTTAQGGEKAVCFQKCDIYDSIMVYNQSNKRVTKSDEEEWKNILTDTYYRLIDSSLVVPYRYYDEATGAFRDGECPDYELIDKDTIEWEIPENDDEKWYVVKGEAEISGRPTVSGKVHLILTDDCVLTVEDGINVYTRNSLSIYGQENGTGKLYAGNDAHNVPYAGIGGGFDAGKVEIHGGEVSAKSEFGAGIGGGYDGGCGGTVNIHGGVVTATSIHGAGIGGGYGDKIGGNGGSVTITGGVVTATSTHCAGIGGGYGVRDNGQAATVTLGDNMVVSEGALINTCYSVKIVEKELHAQTMLPKTSIRVTGTPGLRFAAYVTDAQRKACSSYGFLVARENATLRSDPTKLVFNATNSATGTNDHGVTYTSGEAYNKANGIDKIYAEDGEAFGLPDVEATFFTGVMQGIPQAFYAENLIARPYIVIDGVTLYGETYAKSLYDNACAIRDGGYAGLDEDGIKYINSIISAVDNETDIDISDLLK